MGLDFIGLKKFLWERNFLKFQTFVVFILHQLDLKLIQSSSMQGKISVIGLILIMSLSLPIRILSQKNCFTLNFLLEILNSVVEGLGWKSCLYCRKPHLKLSKNWPLTFFLSENPTKWDKPYFLTTLSLYCDFCVICYCCLWLGGLNFQDNQL